jgi:hypothetical protein
MSLTRVGKPSLAAIVVTDLDLSTRAHNSLAGAGITMVDDLCTWRAEDLLDISYLGTGQLAEIERELARAGRSLALPAPPPLISARQAGQRARRQRERAMRVREPKDPGTAIAAWLKARHGAA